MSHGMRMVHPLRLRDRRRGRRGLMVMGLATLLVLAGWQGGGRSAAMAAMRSPTRPAWTLPTGLVAPESPLQEDETAPAKSRRTRRLPTYYSRVVTEKQRQEIYEIQARYDLELEKLEAELAAKRLERDQAVEAVLDGDQLAEVKRLLAEAAARREARRKAKVAEAEGGSTDDSVDESDDGN